MCEELANLLAIQCLSREFLDTDRGQQAVENMRSALGAVSAEMFLMSCEIVEKADLVPLLPRVNSPTLILVGEHDILTPVDTGPLGAGARRTAEALPHGELTIVPGAAHYILAEDATVCAEAIVEFLSRVDRQSAATA